jgi:cob(I)alamin adenosyltransferase
MAIYTKKGDKGETFLADHKRQVSKSSLRIRALGAIDELNSYLGTIDNSELKDIQRDLFLIASILAGSNLRFSKTKTKKLETKIDKIEKQLPKLKKFVFPQGPLHFARALSRRVEREVVALSKQQKVKPQILTYLNRLSDYLFLLARKVNFDKGIKEKVW